MVKTHDESGRRIPILDGRRDTLAGVPVNLQEKITDQGEEIQKSVAGALRDMSFVVLYEW